MERARKRLLGDILQLQVSAEANARDGAEAIELLRRVLQRRKISDHLTETLVAYWQDQLDALTRARTLNRSLLRQRVDALATEN